MKILYFFLWVIFVLLDPDPDPATQINADPDTDPDPKPCCGPPARLFPFSGFLKGLTAFVSFLRFFWKAFCQECGVVKGYLPPQLLCFLVV
jgi:hypothetical protein